MENSLRKLASIQKILSISPIEDADAIEVAQVLGWNVVIKKGEFKVNDLVVYIEIDSWIPHEIAPFLSKGKEPRVYENITGEKLRSIKLRGQVSQGLILPLNILPNTLEIQEGLDVSSVLNIIKYEPPIPACLHGVQKGNYPSFLNKTDEVRVQNLQTLLEKFKGTKCYISEKLDGSSATYFLKDGEFGVCSRNLWLEEDDTNSFWKIAKLYDIEKNLRNLNRNLAIQGELIGSNVQGNKYGLKEQDIFIFNVIDLDTSKYLDFEDFLEVVKLLNLKTVPIINKDFELSHNIKELVEIASIKSNVNNNVHAEGIVIRALKEFTDVRGTHQNRFSFKVINPNFLLKYEDA